jgi:hypothetical protein
MLWIGIILLVLMVAVFVMAAEKTRYGDFEQKSWWLVSFGIYEWGQAVILAPFWILFSLAMMFWFSPDAVLRLYVLFHVFRAFIEIVLSISIKNYTGWSELLLLHTKTVTKEQRQSMYILIQGIIGLVGVILLLG